MSKFHRSDLIIEYIANGNLFPVVVQGLRRPFCGLEAALNNLALLLLMLAWIGSRDTSSIRAY